MAMDPPAFKRGFSFGGGGWMMVYEFGVAQALREHGAHRDARLIGVSAGALAAVGLALDADTHAAMQSVTTSYVPQARASLLGPFRMREFLVDAVRRHMNLHRVHELNVTPPRVTIVYSSLSARTARRASRFASSEELLQTLMASCCASPFAGLPFKLHGEWVADGVLYDNAPSFHDDPELPTVRISPQVSAVHSDIKPSRYVHPWWYIYPPAPEDVDWVYRLGYFDALQWLDANGFALQVTPQDPGELTWKTRVGKRSGYRGVDDACDAVVSKWLALVSLAIRLELSLRLALHSDRVVLSATALVVSSVGASSLVFPESRVVTFVSLVVAVVVTLLLRARRWGQTMPHRSAATASRRCGVSAACATALDESTPRSSDAVVGADGSSSELPAGDIAGVSVDDGMTWRRYSGAQSMQ
ncbi:hypothetical protein PINS_up005252 [Pythium insidiosum]|nr:hypothetical protein PINS_up005252 [Pythium insidiosum]